MLGREAGLVGGGRHVADAVPHAQLQAEHQVVAAVPLVDRLALAICCLPRAEGSVGGRSSVEQTKRGFAVEEVPLSGRLHTVLQIMMRAYASCVTEPSQGLGALHQVPPENALRPPLVDVAQ